MVAASKGAARARRKRRKSYKSTKGAPLSVEQAAAQWYIKIDDIKSGLSNAANSVETWKKNWCNYEDTNQNAACLQKAAEGATNFTKELGKASQELTRGKLASKEYRGLNILSPAVQKHITEAKGAAFLKQLLADRDAYVNPQGTPPPK